MHEVAPAPRILALRSRAARGPRRERQRRRPRPSSTPPPDVAPRHYASARPGRTPPARRRRDLVCGRPVADLLAQTDAREFRSAARPPHTFAPTGAFTVFYSRMRLLRSASDVDVPAVWWNGGA